MSTEVTDVHKPYDDEGVTYCGWDGHDGCGQVWPCATVRARREAAYDRIDRLVDEDPIALRDLAWKLLAERDMARAESGKAAPTGEPRTWSMPKIPADVERLKDGNGNVWVAINTGVRVWRYRTQRLIDDELLSLVCGPLTEVVSDVA